MKSLPAYNMDEFIIKLKKFDFFGLKIIIYNDDDRYAIHDVQKIEVLLFYVIYVLCHAMHACKE